MSLPAIFESWTKKKAKKRCFEVIRQGENAFCLVYNSSITHQKSGVLIPLAVKLQKLTKLLNVFSNLEYQSKFLIKKLTDIVLKSVGILHALWTTQTAHWGPSHIYPKDKYCEFY